MRTRAGVFRPSGCSAALSRQGSLPLPLAYQNGMRTKGAGGVRPSAGRQNVFWLRRARRLSRPAAGESRTSWPECPPFQQTLPKVFPTEQSWSSGWQADKGFEEELSREAFWLFRGKQWRVMLGCE